jgi:hypothetical protein
VIETGVSSEKQKRKKDFKKYKETYGNIRKWIKHPQLAYSKTRHI